MTRQTDAAPLHVALVAGHPGGIGGLERTCRFVVQAMLPAGWRVTVALSGENIYGSVEAATPDRLRVEPVGWLDPTGAGDREYRPGRIRRSCRWFRSVRPDVALFIQSSNTPFRAAVVGARLAGVPVVVTHRTMPWPPEDHGSRRHLFGLVPGLGLYRTRTILRTRLVALLARAVVYNSRAVRDGYERIYGYPRAAGRVIPNAVAPPPAPELRRPAGPPVIGFVGRIGREKRLDVLLHAMDRLGPDIPARLVLVGEGPERPALQRLARELGLADRLTWTGPTEDVWPAYAGMDVVVLCSPRESSSNMILEAMAAGRAVVVTTAGGLPELVDHGRCGLLVPPLQVEALAGALRRLLTDAGLRATLGRRAAEQARNRHDPQDIRRQWLQTLQAAARPRRAEARAPAPLETTECLLESRTLSGV